MACRLRFFVFGFGCTALYPYPQSCKNSMLSVSAFEFSFWLLCLLTFFFFLEQSLPTYLVPKQTRRYPQHAYSIWIITSLAEQWWVAWIMENGISFHSNHTLQFPGSRFDPILLFLASFKFDPSTRSNAVNSFNHSFFLFAPDPILIPFCGIFIYPS